MSQTGYYRHATIAGGTIVFVCEDDLWTIPLEGGTAHRLTASAGEITFPRLSPDGTLIAFVGRDEGSPEVYVMPAAGGPAKRLTHLGAGVCTISAWDRDGRRILFASDAASPFGTETIGYTVSVEGGAPAPLGLGHMRTLSLHPTAGSSSAATTTTRHAGSATAAAPPATSGSTPRRKRHVHAPDLAAGNLVLADVDRRPHLLPLRPRRRRQHLLDAADGSDLRRHTHETEYFARFPSTDGTTIVYTAGAADHVLDCATDASRVEIETPSSEPQTARRFIDVAEDLEHFAPSPTARRWRSSRAARRSRCRSGRKPRSARRGSRVRYR
jgi:tricorn protease